MCNKNTIELRMSSFLKKEDIVVCSSQTCRRSHSVNILFSLKIIENYFVKIR